MTDLDRRRNNFDLIRLAAALQVVLAHSMAYYGLRESWPALYAIVSLFPGVPIFFVTSGFLVTASIERAPSLAAYARNRVLRIYPALWACFAVTLALLAFLGALTDGFLTSTFWPWVLAQLTIGQFYNPDVLRTVGVGVINGALWTIPVELGFYVLLPLLFRRERIAWVITAAAVSYFAWIWRQSYDGLLAKLLWVSIIPHFWMFAFGMLSYHYRDRVLPFLERRFLLCLAAYLAIAAVIPLYGAAGPLRFAMLAAVVLAAAFTAPTLASRTLRGTDISYGVYIYNMLVVNLFLEAGFTRGWPLLLTTYAATIVLALASWRFVERPALALKGGRRRAGDVPAAVSLGDVRRLPAPRFARSGSERPAPAE